MRVLFTALGIYSRTGGMEAFNQRVVRCLGELARAHGGCAQVLALWDEPRHAARVPEGVVFQPASCSKIRMMAEFLKALRGVEFDAILYGHVLLLPLAVPAARLRPDSPQILFAHGTEVWGDRRFRRIPRWERLLIRRLVDRVACVSRFTMDRMIQAYRLPRSRFALLPNAVDSTDCSRARVGESAGRAPILLTVCRLGRKDTYKGVDKVILAMPEILRAVPEAAYWVVGPGPLKEDLARLARSLGVGERVRFWGYRTQTELCEIYGKARVFIMPSTGEGFGIVFLEAWRHGLPVICGNADASSEVVKNEVTGLIVDPDSVSEISRAAVRLLNDAALCAALAAQGRAAIGSKYNHKAFHERLLKVVQFDSRKGGWLTHGHSEAS